MGNQVVDILKNVSMKVNKGEFISIMGPSGSGKSTLLYLMGGLDKITSGAIAINGNKLSSMNDSTESKMRRKDVGFIFQFYNLIPNLNVEENILLPVLLDGKKRKDYIKKVDQLLEIVGLSDRRHHTPRELSGGQQQRTSIARALINDPDIILADEPIGNLDSKTGTGILELLRDINRTKNKTVIMVTHSKESTAYGNRIVNLKDGEICEDSSDLGGLCLA
ncbi:ABC transporter ATP-binding protein [Paenibacillus plantiphilus]|nr:ABC transporter ATP-binding protein [Paenibacillus plantiphilus]